MKSCSKNVVISVITTESTHLSRYICLVALFYAALCTEGINQPPFDNEYSRVRQLTAYLHLH